ncbi:MAG: hypothetical protein IAE99_10740 [Rhodothermales bacterium]|nr:hypothetical protein [Rhodothermales bacterium]MCA0268093.1 hypothetical protein [Bacteroidota bacterium]
MQHPIEELAPGVVMESAFRPRGSRGFFTRLRLTRTHLDMVVLGRLARRIPLSDVRSFFVGHVSDHHNIRISCESDESLVGSVAEAGVWRLRLIELLGSDRDSSAKHSTRLMA